MAAALRPDTLGSDPPDQQLDLIWDRFMAGKGDRIEDGGRERGRRTKRKRKKEGKGKGK